MSHDKFCKHENCPVLIKEADHLGFKEEVITQGISFHEDPCRLEWVSNRRVEMHHARDMVNVNMLSLKLVHQQLGKRLSLHSLG